MGKWAWVTIATPILGYESGQGGYENIPTYQTTRKFQTQTAHVPNQMQPCCHKIEMDLSSHIYIVSQKENKICLTSSPPKKDIKKKKLKTTIACVKTAL